MARKGRVAVSPAERRRWLEQLESGKGITEIARTARRDIRVAKRHMEIATQERLESEAGRDFLRGRLERHQDQLLEMLGALCTAVKARPPYPPYGATSGAEDPLKPLAGPLRHLYDGLKEHLRQTSVGADLETFRRLLVAYLAEREQVRQGLESEEGRLAAFRQLPARYEWAEHLLKRLEKHLWDGQPIEGEYQRQKSTGDDGRPAWTTICGDFGLLHRPAAQGECAAAEGAYKQLAAWAKSQSGSLESLAHQLGDKAPTLADELEILQLRRLVPGRCTLCPLLGVTSAGSRRR